MTTTTTTLGLLTLLGKQRNNIDSRQIRCHRHQTSLHTPPCRSPNPYSPSTQGDEANEAGTDAGTHTHCQADGGEGKLLPSGCVIVESYVSLSTSTLALALPSELAALLVVIDIPKDVQKRRVDLLRKVAGLKAAAVFGKGQTGAFLFHQRQPYPSHNIDTKNSPS